MEFIRWPCRAVILHFQGRTVKLYQVICAAVNQSEIGIHIRGILKIISPTFTFTVVSTSAHLHWVTELGLRFHPLGCTRDCSHDTSTP